MFQFVQYSFTLKNSSAPQDDMAGKSEKEIQSSHDRVCGTQLQR